jgi:transposase-like protein
MQMPRQEYPRKLKIAVMRDIDSGKGMAQVARLYQINPNRIGAWRSEWRAKSELAFPGKVRAPSHNCMPSALPGWNEQSGNGDRLPKKTSRRFREQPLAADGNGDAGSTSKLVKQPKRGQR